MSKVIDLSKEADEFLKKIEELSGEKITSCIQCGICSGSCPMINEMDITPAQIMLLTVLGQKEELLNSKSIWICASCFNCKVRCPRELDLAKVAEALRQVVLRTATDRISINDISHEEMMELPQIAIVAACRRLTD
ncbi:4Fe-4S dicluster domain-containing protein [bacterium]|nr:4Fe-4S dicluster domain-containing protein [bacterium]